MTIECFDATEKLLVVAAVDEDLRVVLDGSARMDEMLVGNWIRIKMKDSLCQHTQRSRVEFFLLKLLQLFGCHFRFWFGGWKIEWINELI